MTGTAMTEADEFAEIYKLDVVEIPTNVAVRRATTRTTRSTAPPREKYEAVAKLIDEARERGPAGAGRHHHRSRRARRSASC